MSLCLLISFFNSFKNSSRLSLEVIKYSEILGCIILISLILIQSITLSNINLTSLISP